MKALNIPFSQPRFRLPVLVMLLIVPHVQASNSAIDNFLQCLPRYSNPLYPISNALYSRKDTSFLFFIQFYVGQRNFNVSSTSNSKPLAMVETLDGYYVQAMIVCAKVNGLKVTVRDGDFHGLSYASDVPLVILEI